MSVDRFGNRHAPGLPYARGQILASTEDDIRKLRHAWQIMKQRIQKRGSESVFNFSGLERALPIRPKDLPFMDDDVAPALYMDQFRKLALTHLGGSSQIHETALFNRVTAGIFATHLALVKPGDVVVGVSAGYSHPAVVRAAAQVGAQFADTRGVGPFAESLQREQKVSLVVLTRLAVTYDMLPAAEVRDVIRLAHEKGALVLGDDAGGARVGPAIFGQPRMLEIGADVVVTGLDKYGTVGPRLGLLAGERNVVGQIHARGFEFGLEARPMLYAAAVRSLEQYTPVRVQTLVDTTKQVSAALRARFGNRVHETPVTAQLPAEDILEIAMERARLNRPSIVPIEATAALAMLLLEDYGVLTVHFAALPPGTSSLLLKFIPPETLTRFGGPEAFARAIDNSLTKLGGFLSEPDGIRILLMGERQSSEMSEPSH